ncbi:MAG: UDP-N-acetylmuramate dehydrogenase [Candidatus Cloacimonetes bacterium]|nr:UDP-N-acetylmuramate dehydrogenase [Candidatus Cloacimonadota bacterium]
MFDSKLLTPILSRKLCRSLSHFKNSDNDVYVFVPEEVSELQSIIKEVVEQNRVFFPIGGGSNILIGKVEDLVLISDLKLSKKIDVKRNEVVVSANYNINALMMHLHKYNLGGLEFLAGIPAHLGGIVKMNAGAFGKSISEFVKWVAIIDKFGNKQILDISKLDFKYRYSNIDGFIYEICLSLPTTNEVDSMQLIRSNIELRKAKQPLAYPNLGCFFKNPQNESAGSLIEKCGLKGKRIGGAEVSQKHANFIINKDNASFADAVALMKFIQQKVDEKFNIKLETEIEVIGK